MIDPESPSLIELSDSVNNTSVHINRARRIYNVLILTIVLALVIVLIVWVTRIHSDNSITKHTVASICKGLDIDCSDAALRRINARV